MHAYSLQTPIQGLIFDMDNTLYTHPAYARHQEAVLVQRLAEELLVSLPVALDRVAETRSRLTHANSGKKPSLGTIFLNLGISIATSVAWRNEFIKPELFLKADDQLVGVMQQLSSRFRLAIVTNNPVAIARRTLEIIGISHQVPFIVGLDSTGVSKPDPAAFSLATRQLACPAASIVSIGDRFEIDIEPALELGMGGVLVDGVEDVYLLPEFFLGKS